MRFLETGLTGAYLIDPEPQVDERGLFMRTFCRREFAAAGLITDYVQCNLSINEQRGTLRGLHFQKAPHEEGKLVRCTAGTIFDVIVDLRRSSPTYRRWVGFELSQHNRRALYIPPGFAHGFQTLVPHSDVFYQMAEFYHPESASGVRWDDPLLGIAWPVPDPILSERDATLPRLET